MWTYQGRNIDTAPEEYQGFVYCITELATNKKYIGKKNFWTVKKLPPLKGKVNKRHRKVETDWKDYWGSNTTLQERVNKFGSQGYRREILRLCESKNLLNYWEAKLQFEKDVLLREDYFNEFIGCRINSKGLKDE